MASLERTPKPRLTGFLGTACLGLLLAAIVPSCGGSASNGSGTDSHTHWLDQCATNADCGSLECRCGVCTQSCSAAADCARLAADAECAPIAGCSSPTPVCVSAGSVTDAGVHPGNGICGPEVHAGEKCAGSSTCWTPCVPPGYTERISCDAGIWVAGHGLFPCGDAGTATDGGKPHTDGGTAHPEAGAGDAGMCRPLDAHTGNLFCTMTVGYGWDGRTCTPIVCSCEGTECDRIDATLDACQRAHEACFASRGIEFSCTTSEDCAVTTRNCCGPCGVVGADDVVAINVDSVGARGAECAGEPACPPCITSFGTYSAVCRGGRCQVRNFAGYAGCLKESDCTLQAKDCCACGVLHSNAFVAMSNPTGYTTDECATVDCAPCADGPRPLSADHATCNLSTGACEDVYGG